MNPARHMRKANVTILTIALAALIAVQVMLLFMVLDAAEQAEGDSRDSLLKFVRLILVALCLSVLVVVALLVRWLGNRLTHPGQPFKRMEYMDAWTEAGRRLKAEDAPPIEEFEGKADEGPGEDEGQGEGEGDR